MRIAQHAQQTLVAIGVGLGIILALTVPAAAGASARWTIMAYLDGEGKLAPAAQHYLEQLLGVQPHHQVNVVAQVNREEDGGAGLVAVRYSASQSGDYRRQSLGLIEFDNHLPLANFIKWAMQKAPAQHYALLIMGHSRPPWSGAEISTAPQPLSSEHLARMVRAAVGQAVSEPIEVIFLEYCYGVTVEVVAQLHDAACYLVGPPGPTYSPGLPWADILRHLQQHPEMTGGELAGATLQAAQQYWQSEPDLPVALVAIDLQRVNEVVNCLAEFSDTAVTQMPGVIAEVTLARSRTMSWGPQDNIADLGGFANALAELTTSPVLAQRAWELGQAIRAATLNSYIQGPGSEGKVKGAGLGIFFPVTGESDRLPAAYQSVAQLYGHNNWGAFLQSYLTGLRDLASAAGPRPLSG